MREPLLASEIAELGLWAFILLSVLWLGYSGE
jgi:hypothetical protein